MAKICYRLSEDCRCAKGYDCPYTQDTAKTGCYDYIDEDTPVRTVIPIRGIHYDC